MSENTNLSGKTALVTGGSRGIGAGIARSLAAQGATVAVTYWSSADAALAVVAEIEANGGKAMALRANNSDADAARKGVRDAVDALGSLDIIVNNAGGGWFEPFTETSDEHIEATLNLNVRGTIYATQEALKHLPNGGRIITIGSVSAVTNPYPGSAIYGMSKAALVGFTKGLARDLGHRAITANIIQPGPIDTDGNPADGESGDLLIELTALKRFGTTADVGALVAWVASDEANFMTGSVITSDGGWTA